MTRSRALLFVACTACTVPLALAGCGGSDTSSLFTTESREAAPGFTPESTTCPEASPSFRWDGKVTNRLDVPVTLAVGEYTCDDWSGASTPGAVLNGKIIAPRASMNVRLEPREYRTRKWTMAFAGQDGDALGTARLWMRQSGSIIGEDPDWSTPNQGAYSRTWTYAGNPKCAWFLPLAETSAPDTPTSLLPNYPQWMGIVVSRGRVAVVTQAGGGSCPGE
jgi:hypothetical protein